MKQNQPLYMLYFLLYLILNICILFKKPKRLVQKACDLSPQDVFTPPLSGNRWRRKYYRRPCLDSIDVKAELQDALVAPGVLNRNGSKFRVTSGNVPSEESVNLYGIKI